MPSDRPPCRPLALVSDDYERRRVRCQLPPDHTGDCRAFIDGLRAQWGEWGGSLNSTAASPMAAYHIDTEAMEAPDAE